MEHILAQTNYTPDEAAAKLAEHQGNYMSVLREYMGLPPIVAETDKVIPQHKVQQEMFRQIRKNMNAINRQYFEQHPVDLEQVVNSFKEEEARQKTFSKN